MAAPCNVWQPLTTQNNQKLKDAKYELYQPPPMYQKITYSFAIATHKMFPRHMSNEPPICYLGDAIYIGYRRIN